MLRRRHGALVCGGYGDDVVAFCGVGIDLIQLKGGLEDCRFVKNADGGYTIFDRKNEDGSAVGVGQVSAIGGRGDDTLVGTLVENKNSARRMRESRRWRYGARGGTDATVNAIGVAR